MPEFLDSWLLWLPLIALVVALLFCFMRWRHWELTARLAQAQLTHELERVASLQEERLQQQEKQEQQQLLMLKLNGRTVGSFVKLNEKDIEDVNNKFNKALQILLLIILPLALILFLLSFAINRQQQYLTFLRCILLHGFALLYDKIQVRAILVYVVIEKIVVDGG